MVEKLRQAQALHFIEAFPEAQAFHVVLLTQEKRAIVVKPQCSRHELIENLQVWLCMKEVHFFIRPLLRSLVMVDLDHYSGDLEIVLRLCPRALVCTSSGSYQGWWTVSDTATRTAPWVMSKLTEALGGDTRSAKPTQQGRLPGSVNVKPGKGHTVYLLHSCVQNLDEKVFLGITSQDSLCIVGSEVTAVIKASARSATESNHKARDKVVSDRGGASSSCVPVKPPHDEGQLPHAMAGDSRPHLEPAQAAPCASAPISREQVENLVAEAFRKRFGYAEDDKHRVCSGWVVLGETEEKQEQPTKPSTPQKGGRGQKEEMQGKPTKLSTPTLGVGVGKQRKTLEKQRKPTQPSTLQGGGGGGLGKCFTFIY